MTDATYINVNGMVQAFTCPKCSQTAFVELDQTTGGIDDAFGMCSDEWVDRTCFCTHCAVEFGVKDWINKYTEFP